MAALGEVPFGRYYGSVDSTPLFVMLAAAYLRRTGDLAVHSQRSGRNIERALAWIDEYGDCDGDGFVEYARQTDKGLVQQGWKDSHDSVFHADGTLAEGPIALCEVQGYVYARVRRRRGDRHGAGSSGAGRDATAQGRRPARAVRRDVLVRGAGRRSRWRSTATKQPCRVRSSNAGHALWTGIADPAQRARTVARRC